MPSADLLASAADAAERILARHRVRLTLGGEPTYVPERPEGSEWNVTALGPTKLRYAYALADALIAGELPQAVPFYTPGKRYPGEVNPRWAVTLVWNRDGAPLVPSLSGKPAPAARMTPKPLNDFRGRLLDALKLKRGWLHGIDPFDAKRWIWVLPVDQTDAGRFISADWRLGPEIELLRSEGPAGLRLPLNSVRAKVSRRALTVELRDGFVEIFLPPLLQPGFLACLDACIAAANQCGAGPLRFGGYPPSDEAESWVKLGIAADPGVLEINLPPCHSWTEYRRWMACLEKTTEAAGLRSYKTLASGQTIGTGGGNHLLFGGPGLEGDHPLFSRPAWIVSMLRYWQHHPSLAYFFTGQYVGPSSQAPRPDESAASLYDLEMAYRFLEALPPGDHRHLISETLRHLHTDSSGNTHRCESSFDKFWNASFDGGCRGLIEFRAVETLPHAEWMSAVALLWKALAAHLLNRPFSESLVDFGDDIHDRYFLPTPIWDDFQRIRTDLASGGVNLPEAIYREIWEWRFPEVFRYEQRGASLVVRRAHDGWPLLCETPLEGGSTSRFVDTSIERLEFMANREFARNCCLAVQGRALKLKAMGRSGFGAGMRYRRSALHPCLHPGIPVQLPLHITVKSRGQRQAFRMDAAGRAFAPCSVRDSPRDAAPCRKLRDSLLTFDLRLD